MGKTLSGKSYLQNHLADTAHQIPKIITTTTRPKRFNEVDGLDYFFITPTQANQAIINHSAIAPRKYQVANGQTWTYYLDPNTLYQTLITAPHHTASLVLDLQGFLDLTAYVNDARHRQIHPWMADLKIEPIYLDVDLFTRLKRYVDGNRHTENAKEVLRRLYDDEFRAFNRLKDPDFISRYHIKTIHQPNEIL